MIIMLQTIVPPSTTLEPLINFFSSILSFFSFNTWSVAQLHCFPLISYPFSIPILIKLYTCHLTDLHLPRLAILSLCRRIGTFQCHHPLILAFHSKFIWWVLCCNCIYAEECCVSCWWHQYFWNAELIPTLPDHNNSVSGWDQHKGKSAF